MPSGHQVSVGQGSVEFDARGHSDISLLQPAGQNGYWRVLGRRVSGGVSVSVCVCVCVCVCVWGHKIDDLYSE